MGSDKTRELDMGKEQEIISGRVRKSRCVLQQKRGLGGKGFMRRHVFELRCCGGGGEKHMNLKQISKLHRSIRCVHSAGVCKNPVCAKHPSSPEQLRDASTLC